MKDYIAIKSHATKTYLEKCPYVKWKNETHNSHSHIQQLFIECLLYARHCSRYWEHSLPSWSLSIMIRNFVYILIFPCVCALSCFSCVYLWPYGLSPQNSSVHEILLARILEKFDIYPSRGSSWPRDQNCGSFSSWIFSGGFFTPETPGKPLIFCQRLNDGLPAGMISSNS